MLPVAEKEVLKAAVRITDPVSAQIVHGGRTSARVWDRHGISARATNSKKFRDW